MKGFVDSLMQMDFESASRLLEAGFEINSATTEDGWTALHLAAEHQLPDVAAWLLERGADVNARDRAGQTPLFVAIDSESEVAKEKLNTSGETKFPDQMTKLLLLRGADPSACRGDGISPLRLARRREHASATELLLRYGASE